MSASGYAVQDNNEGQMSSPWRQVFAVVVIMEGRQPFPNFLSSTPTSFSLSLSVVDMHCCNLLLHSSDSNFVLRFA